MASTKTQIKPIRIANETAEYFEGKPLNRYVECLHRLVCSGKIVLSGEEIVLPENKNQKNSVYTDAMGEFEEMASCCGMTTEELIGGLFSMLEEGEIVIENGRLMPSMPEWAERLSESCQEIGYDVDKIVDSAIKSLKTF